MKIHRFIASVSLATPEIRLTDHELVHQLVDVLRLKVGEEVMLGDGLGMEALAKIHTFTKKEVVLTRIGEPKRNVAEPSVKVTLCCAILKRENFEFVVQKATELGASEILPLLTRRTIKTGIKHERLQQIAKEAAEQSGRGMVPVVQEPMRFAEALKRAEEADASKLFFETGPDVRERAPSKAESRVFLFIGPEGGWDPEEVEYAKHAGCRIVSLGARILRAETAAAVACWEAVGF